MVYIEDVVGKMEEINEEWRVYLNKVSGKFVDKILGKMKIFQNIIRIGKKNLFSQL